MNISRVLEKYFENRNSSSGMESRLPATDRDASLPLALKCSEKV